ncbi:MAG: putative acyl esterase [Verrucomicrobiales bacterium]
MTLSDDELATNRHNVFDEQKAHRLYDQFHKDRSSDLSFVECPVLSCANWGGQGIHPRGNFNGFIEASSEHKWLEVHGDTHWSLFSSGYGLALQKEFFDHYLKDLDNGWEQGPRVRLHIRSPGEKFEMRHENEWPLARTQWTTFALDAAAESLQADASKAEETVAYETMGHGVTFWLPVSDEPVEITGPLATTLYLSSETTDADLFVVLRLFDPDGAEVTFMGAQDSNTPIANGWLRASHRAPDPEKSLPYRPYHPHDRVEPLVPGEIYRCEVELVSTCIVVPPGYRLGLNVRGCDYEYTGPLSEFGKKFHYSTRGTGGMTHNDPDDRPPAIFDTLGTVHTGPGHPSTLILPIIP